MRKQNSTCVNCGKTYYRRPAQAKYRAICSDCRRNEFSAAWTIKTCPACKQEFRYKKSDNHNKDRITCSRKCSNANRTGTEYTKDKIRSRQHRRLISLLEKYKCVSCMVVGCEYNKTFDLHRLVPGKKGGKYEFGNMFAICPNHHAEHHRKICVLEKIDDSHLRAIYGNSPGIGEPSCLENKSPSDLSVRL